MRSGGLIGPHPFVDLGGGRVPHETEMTIDHELRCGNVVNG